MKSKWMNTAVLTAALGLAVAACGSSNSADPTDVDTGEADTAPTGDELPINESPDESPVVEGACLPDEPDCEDMIVDELDQELPVPDEGATDEGEPGAVTSGMTVDGGLTITEALATHATGVLAVHGHLFDDGSGPTLCEALEGDGERYICGGPQIAIDNFDPGTVVAEIIHHDGLTYTEHDLTLFGALDAGVLTVDNLVVG